MAAHNGAEWITEQLQSFNSQTTLPDELIVCDDCSSDSTVKLLQEFKKESKFKVVVINNLQNIGYTKNFEKALSYCSGDFIFISDQDDLWEADKISTVLSSFKDNPQKHVFINDAMYVNARLQSSNVTVLQKVLDVSKNRNAHIAGACTMITRDFRDFIVPFPQEYCPAYDAYIHRWANLTKSKQLIEKVLQVWRIHGGNFTKSEMGRHDKISSFKLFVKYKNVDSKSDYLLKILQYKKMREFLYERKDSFLKAKFPIELDEVAFAIDRCIEAYANRAKLFDLSGFRRIKLIIYMYLAGQYQHFYGYKSLLKDLTRFFVK